MGLFTPKNHEKLLDNTLYEVPNTNTEITWADVLEGTLIMGATGSGKSSGPGRYIAKAMLNKGFGFCVLCAKKDEKDRWIEYAKETGRSKDVILFNKETNLKFNFLKYEMERDGEGAGDILHISNMLVNLNEQIRIIQSGGGKSDEKFWDNALRRLISRTISLLKSAKENISIYNIRRLIADSLTSDNMKMYKHVKAKISTEEKIPEKERAEAKKFIKEWASRNYFIKILENLETYTKTDDLNLTLKYWTYEFANLSEKTRSIIVESVFGIIEPFLVEGILKNQFANDINKELEPESIIKEKKIVIVDFSVKEFGLSGVLASAIYKLMFQSAMERRDITKEKDPKPVSLWIDEYQTFCYPSVDALFQATARSSWVATIYITQNLNGIYQVMGDNQAQARAKSLLGNLNLKFFASNADFDTNKWASDMIGQHWINIDTLSYSENMELSKTQRPERRRKVEIDEFTTLKTGRSANKYIVETVVFKAGKTWGEEGENHALVEFNQK